MKGMVTNPGIPIHHRNKVAMALESIKKVRQISVVSLAFILPPFVVMAAYPAAQRFAYIFVPIDSYTFAVLVVRHSVRSFLISRAVAIQRADSRLQSQKVNAINDNNNHNGHDYMDMPDEAVEGDEPKRGALGRKVKFERIRPPPRLMSKVTEEPTNIITVTPGDNSYTT